MTLTQQTFKDGSLNAAGVPQGSHSGHSHHKRSFCRRDILRMLPETKMLRCFVANRFTLKIILTYFSMTEKRKEPFSYTSFEIYSRIRL